MVFQNNVLAGNAANQGVTPFNTSLIPNSVAMDGSDDYFSFTTAGGDAVTHSTTKVIMATWFKLGTVGAAESLMVLGSGTDGNNTCGMYVSSANRLVIQCNTGSEYASTEQVLRDTAWYHALFSVDLGQSGQNKARLYINGIENTLWNQNTGIADFGTSFDDKSTYEVGRIYNGDHFTGYLAQSIFLDDKSIQAGDYAITDFLDVFTFGSNGSQYGPRSNGSMEALVSATKSSTHTNSAILTYANSSSLGLDSSSNPNTFTNNGTIATSQQTPNTPSKEYPIWSHNSNNLATSAMPLSNGNRTIGGADPAGVSLDWWPQDGKWYFEAVATDLGGSSSYPGLYEQTAIGNRVAAPWNATTGTHHWAIGHTSGTGGPVRNNNSFTNYAGGAITADGTRVAFAYDMDNRKCYYGTISGSTITWLNSGDPTSGATGTGAAPYSLTSKMDLIPVHLTGTSNNAWTYYFESSNWAAEAPTDYKECHTGNLTAPEYQGIDYFDTTLYEGNGGTQRVGDFVPYTDDYNVANSAMFMDDDNRYLTRTSQTSDGEKFTISFWAKRSGIPTASDAKYVWGKTNATASTVCTFGFEAASELGLFVTSSAVNVVTTRKFNDNQAWHHYMVAVDTSLGVAASRVRIYYDGVEETSMSASSFPSQDYVMPTATSGRLTVGTSTLTTDAASTSRVFEGYLAEFCFVDDAQLTPSSFGQTDTATNRWVPKDVSGLTFGGKGYYLKFGGAFGTSDGAGDDSSGNSNDFTEGGTWATTDQFIDTPTKNFAVIQRFDTDVQGTLTEGDTKLAGGTGPMVGIGMGASGSPISKGKYYIELKPSEFGGNTSWGVSGTLNLNVYGYVGQEAGQTGAIFQTTGQHVKQYVNTSAGSNVSMPFTFGANDIIIIAIDFDLKSVWYGFWDSDSASQIQWLNAAESFTTTFPTASPTQNISHITNPIIAIHAGSASHTWLINTGSQVVYSGATTTNSSAADGRFITASLIPTGFKALNQDNLDDTTDLLTDLAWIKNRDATDHHHMFDRVRGVNIKISPNNDGEDSAAAEETNVNTLSKFLKRGVEIGPDDEVNTSGESYVLWQWLGGGTAATSDPAGTIASTVITSAPKHFSIVTYTGTGSAGTVGHGLGAVPEMMCLKLRPEQGSWIVYHAGVASDAETDFLLWADNIAVADNATMFNDTAPTADVFTVGTAANVNDNTKAHLAYCWRSVPGVCKVGNYIGNGNADGPMINLGFKPRWIMLKSMAAREWPIFDTARDPINLADQRLNASTTEAESADFDIDFLVNGFKHRNTSNDGNESGVKFVYLAMAEIGGNGTLPPIYGR